VTIVAARTVPVRASLSRRRRFPPQLDPFLLDLAERIKNEER
jgi:hypothetical protein